MKRSPGKKDNTALVVFILMGAAAAARIAYQMVTKSGFKVRERWMEI